MSPCGNYGGKLYQQTKAKKEYLKEDSRDPEQHFLKVGRFEKGTLKKELSKSEKKEAVVS